MKAIAAILNGNSLTKREKILKSPKKEANVSKQMEEKDGRGRDSTTVSISHSSFPAKIPSLPSHQLAFSLSVAQVHVSGGVGLRGGEYQENRRRAGTRMSRAVYTFGDPFVPEHLPNALIRN